MGTWWQSSLMKGDFIFIFSILLYRPWEPVDADYVSVNHFAELTGVNPAILVCLLAKMP